LQYIADATQEAILSPKICHEDGSNDGTAKTYQPPRRLRLNPRPKSRKARRDAIGKIEDPIRNRLQAIGRQTDRDQQESQKKATRCLDELNHEVILPEIRYRKMTRDAR
jgi:hypothetical protein